MEQAHVFISGFVQGVGFRAFIKRQAQRLGLTGFVKNLKDGRVESVLQGEKENIDEMIQLCNHGPMLSEVEEVVVEWEEAREESDGFKIDH